jgi:acetyltransferase-like isoleucine patch superfamily enzyme
MLTTAHHPADELGRPSMQYVSRGIEVGDGCWLGARVLVLPGVSICSGVTVAAGAVVTKDLTQPGLYAGVPARLVRRGGAET